MDKHRTVGHARNAAPTWLTASLLGASAAVAITASPAMAQDAAPDREVSASEGHSDTIVVTARRREESLQRVPVAITVVGPEDLRKANVQSITDLRHQVPSLGINTQGFGNYSPISIRGQGGYSPGGTSAVASYINEVPVQSKSDGGDFSGGRYYDLERVQVLKGPQGTLFGRNTTGGALLFETKRPTNEWEGYIEGTVGNLDRRELTFAANAPLVDDTVLLRIAGQRQSAKSYAKKLRAPETGAGAYREDYDVWSGRASLSLKLAENLTNLTVGEVHRQEGNKYPLVLVAVNPDGFANLVFPGLMDALKQQQALGHRTLIPTDTANLNEARTWNVTDILEYEASDNLTFRNIFGYSELNFSTQLDTDATSFPIVQKVEQGVPLKKWQISEEAQLQGTSFAGRFEWVAGLFLLKEKQPEFERFTNIVFGGPSQTQSRSRQTSTAVYAQGTYDLGSWLDGLKVTAGLRYTWDSRQLERISGDTTARFEGKFEEPTWTVGLDYQIDPDTMIYLASRRGYRSGGLNPSARELENTRFDSEYLTDVEFGVKADWHLAGMPVRTNLALYHQWYDDIQLTAIVVEDSDGQPAPQVLTRNAGSARLYGVEFEGQIQPTANLNLSGGLSYFHETFTRLAPGVNPALGDYVPKLLPAFQANIHARYLVSSAGSTGEISLSAGWSWLSKTVTSISYAPEPFDTIPGYGLVNVSFDWNRVMNTPIDASIFVTNALGRDGLNASIPLYEDVGYVVGVYTEPRLFGLRVRHRF